ncbi:MAG TPA: hypothetical protein VJN18_01675 [Polyangiaceae bacterium]|nr:hypothetical protein [Polyangiaceae bacterium]
MARLCVLAVALFMSMSNLMVVLLLVEGPFMQRVAGESFAACPRC